MNEQADQEVGEDDDYGEEAVEEEYDEEQDDQAPMQGPEAFDKSIVSTSRKKSIRLKFNGL